VKSCSVVLCKLTPSLCRFCAGTPTVVDNVKRALGIVRKQKPPAEPVIIPQIDDPEWEGGEAWRHPLDPLAHKRQRKPKVVRFWHGFGSDWIIDQTGVLNARIYDQPPPQPEPENFARPNVPPWWRR
jgi:hypothetical protein